MKPHEQQWQMKHNGGSPVIIDGNGKVLMHVVDVEAGRLAAGAPDMARALLSAMVTANMIARAGVCPTCDPGNEGAEVGGELFAECTSSLRKAGVVP